MNAAVKQQPLIEAAHAAQLACCRTGLNAVRSQVFEKGCNILLRRSEQNPVAGFNEFGKRLQVAVVCFAGERAQPLLHAQVDLVVVQERSIAGGVHRFDYPRRLSSLRVMGI